MTSKYYNQKTVSSDGKTFDSRLEDNQIVVEDTKNEYLEKQPMFVYKKKLMKALYGIDVIVINNC